MIIAGHKSLCTSDSCLASINTGNVLVDGGELYAKSYGNCMVALNGDITTKNAKLYLFTESPYGTLDQFLAQAKNGINMDGLYDAETYYSTIVEDFL